MYRKIFVADSEEDLTIKLPSNYLNKQVEIIAFELDSNDYETKKSNAKKAIAFFRSINVDTTGFKFNREEANER